MDVRFGPLTYTEGGHRQATCHPWWCCASRQPAALEPPRNALQFHCSASNLVLRRGTITGVTGGKGAGKSTFLRLIARVLTPTHRGSVIAYENQRGAASVALVTEDEPLHPSMTVLETVLFAISMRGVGPAVTTLYAYEQYAKTLLLALRLIRKKDVMVRDLSRGERLLLAVGIGITSCPDLLILDDLTATLLMCEVRDLWQLLRRLTTQGVNIVVTMPPPSPKIWPLLDQLIVLANGQLLFCAPPREAITSLLKTCARLKPQALQRALNEADCVDTLLGKIMDSNPTVTAADERLTVLSSGHSLVQTNEDDLLSLDERTGLESDDEAEIQAAAARLDQDDVKTEDRKKRDEDESDEGETSNWNVSECLSAFATWRSQQSPFIAPPAAAAGSAVVTKTRRPSFWTQTAWMLWKWFITSFRAGAEVRAIGVGLLLWSAFLVLAWQPTAHSQQMAVTHVLVALVFVLFFSIMWPHAKVKAFIEHAQVFQHHRISHLCRTSAFVTAQTVYSTIELGLLSAVFTVPILRVVFPAAPWTDVLLGYLFITLHMLTHAVLLEMIAFVIVEQPLTHMYALTVALASVSLSGVIVSRDEINPILRWLSAFSYTRMAILGLVATFFQSASAPPMVDSLIDLPDNRLVATEQLAQSWLMLLLARVLFMFVVYRRAGRPRLLFG
jgi:ABC-type multidrug transport system ATPase subunit